MDKFFQDIIDRLVYKEENSGNLHHMELEYTTIEVYREGMEDFVAHLTSKDAYGDYFLLKAIFNKDAESRVLDLIISGLRGEIARHAEAADVATKQRIAAYEAEQKAKTDLQVLDIEVRALRKENEELHDKNMKLQLDINKFNEEREKMGPGYDLYKKAYMATRTVVDTIAKTLKDFSAEEAEHNERV